jgi:predicted Zn-dependent protease
VGEEILPKAVSVCSQAYARDPQNPRLQAGLVSALVDVGAFDRAEAMLAMLLKKEGPSSQLLRMAGHLAWFCNRPAEAIDYYRRVLKEQPFDSPRGRKHRRDDPHKSRATST